MGFGGISIWQLLIILAIVILIFGTKRLKGLGGDVGSAIKSFKKAVNEDDKQQEEGDNEQKQESAEPKDPASLEKKDAEFAEAEAEKKTDKNAH